MSTQKKMKSRFRQNVFGEHILAIRIQPHQQKQIACTGESIVLTIVFVKCSIEKYKKLFTVRE